HQLEEDGTDRLAERSAARGITVRQVEADPREHFHGLLVGRDRLAARSASGKDATHLPVPAVERLRRIRLLREEERPAREHERFVESALVEVERAEIALRIRLRAQIADRLANGLRLA